MNQVDFFKTVLVMNFPFLFVFVSAECFVITNKKQFSTILH